MIYSNPIIELSTTDISKLDDHIVENLIFKYVKYILQDKELKVFKGISREYTDKYIKDFQKILKINNFNPDELLIPVRNEYDEDLYSYTSFMVSYDGRGHAFGSFQSAYLYATEKYLDTIILFEDDIIKDIADNVEVWFGHVLIKDEEMIFKDVISVVNHNYYGLIYDELPFE
jgi:hypothetical protein